MANNDGKVVAIHEELKAPSIDDRIADAFESSMSSSALAELLREVRQTSTDAKAASNAAEASALDPKLRPADVAAARQQMGDADFRSKRMDAAAEQIAVLLNRAKTSEAAERAAIEYAAAKTERDELANDLAEYEKHAAAIVALMIRITENDQRLRQVNIGQSAETWLYSAQKVARRGASGEFGVQHDSLLPNLVDGVRLPNFHKNQTSVQGYLWPPNTY